MRRYLLVKGIKGVLVSDPRSLLGVPMYAGKRRLPDAEYSGSFANCFEDVEMVVQQDPSLDKAVKAGDLLKIAGPVVAGSYGEAEKLLKPGLVPIAPNRKVKEDK